MYIFLSVLKFIQGSFEYFDGNLLLYLNLLVSEESKTYMWNISTLTVFPDFVSSNFNPQNFLHLTEPCLGKRGEGPFLNKPWFLHVCSTNLLKTLREKEKLLFISYFSFFHNVFYHFGELKIVVCKLFRFGKV